MDDIYVMDSIHQNEMDIDDLKEQMFLLKETVQALMERMEKLEQRRPVYVPPPLY